MAASDYDFARDRTSICEKALRLVGAVNFGDPISGEEMVNAVDTLNEMVKEWQTKDVYLWQLQVLSYLVDALVREATPVTDTPVIQIDAARLVNGTTEEELEVISWREYDNIPNKDETGLPSRIALSSNSGSGVVAVHPVPVGPASILVRAVVPLKDFDTTTSKGDAPAHWNSALVYGLASRLADDYKLQLAERNHLINQAQYYFNRARGSDRNKGERRVFRGAY